MPTVECLDAGGTELGRTDVLVDADRVALPFPTDDAALVLLDPADRTWAKVTSTNRRHEYLLKTVNDRAFITQLAEEIGYEWYVKEDDLVFRPRPALGTPVVSLSWDDGGLHRLSARASAVDGAKSVEVRGWDDAKRVDTPQELGTDG